MLSVLLKSAVPGASYGYGISECVVLRMGSFEIVLAEKSLEIKAQRKQISNAEKKKPNS